MVELGVALVVPVVHSIHRVVTIHQWAAILLVVDEVAPSADLLTAPEICIVEVVGLKLGILILKGQYTQLIVEVIFGRLNHQVTLVDCGCDALCSTHCEVLRWGLLLGEDATILEGIYHCERCTCNLGRKHHHSRHNTLIRRVQLIATIEVECYGRTAISCSGSPLVISEIKETLTSNSSTLGCQRNAHQLRHIFILRLGVKPHIRSLMLQIEGVILIERSIAEVTIVTKIAIGALLSKHISTLGLTSHIVEDVTSTHYRCATLKCEVRQSGVLSKG